MRPRDRAIFRAPGCSLQFERIYQLIKSSEIWLEFFTVTDAANEEEMLNVKSGGKVLAVRASTMGNAVKLTAVASTVSLQTS